MDPEKLSKYQFSAGTKFHDAKNRDAGKTVVTAHRQGDDPTTTPPVAALYIGHGGISQASSQLEINNPDSSWEHGVNEDEHGQRFWAGGSFDKPWASDIDSMSWLGTTDRNPHLLRGLLATAGVEHARTRGPGRLHADLNMTEDSARIARRLSKSLGLKPHPSNPEMKSNNEDWKEDIHLNELTNHGIYTGSADVLQPVSSDEVAVNVGTIFGKRTRKKKPTGPQPEQLKFDI
jgi:hypothetical protein